jgi:hypothetical protein
MVVARLVAVSGTIKVRPRGEMDWSAVVVGAALGAGDSIRAWASSTAELEYLDGLKLSIHPDSYVVIEARETEVVGRAVYDAPSRDQTGLRIGPATVRGVPGERRSGELELRDGRALVRQKEGASEVVTAGRPVRIKANQQVAVDAKGAEPVTELPAAPPLASPASQAELTYRTPSRTPTVLVWQAVPGAAGYRVQLDTDPALGSPIVDNVTSATNLSVGPLDVGPTYYWQVRARRADGAEGFPSALGSFMVKAAAAAATGPTLAVDLLESHDTAVKIEGHTDPGARLTINGESVEVRADGRFREYLTLPSTGERKIVLRAQNAQGGTSTLEREVAGSP